MTKEEVQQRVLKDGKPLDLDKFNWDEKTRTFSSSDNGLVIDFKDIYSYTFKTGSNCVFNTSSNCVFNTGDNCTFDTGSNCVFNTGDNCTFKTSSYCTFKTGSYCVFNTGDNCTFNVGSNCVIIRRDVYEVIEPEENIKIKLNDLGKKGFVVLDEKTKEEILEIDGKKFSKSIIRKALEEYFN